MKSETTHQPFREAAEFVDSCIEAIGGRDSLYKVKSLHQQIERRFGNSREGARTFRLDLYRAVGGRIRIEEFAENDRKILTIVNGLSGVRRCGRFTGEQFVCDESQELTAIEAALIKRGVRLYPRNFLAHADEHQYIFCGARIIEDRNLYILDLPVEEVSYHFDPETMLCARKIDRQIDCTIEYEDYRDVDGIVTPFVERTIEGEGGIRVDEIRSISYNLDLKDDLFDV